LQYLCFETRRMFRSRMLRWHTFRVVLLTSFVWITIGFCVLLFYGDCWDGINCGSKPKLDDSPKAAPIIKEPDDDNNVDNAVSRSNVKSNSPLPPYSTRNLKFWKPAGELVVA